MSNQYTTWNYVLSFKGWAQCRMATDPDPANDPRGVSGYSFALPGEPDFSQIVYFQNTAGVVQRSNCPNIGVHVVGGYHYKARVFSDGQEEFEGTPKPIKRDSPLHGATVNLLNDPIFDSRNSTLVYNGYGLITPFDLQIESTTKVEKQGVSFTRSYYVDPDDPTTDLQSIPIDQLESHVMSTAIYNSTDLNKTAPGSPDILLESRILDPIAYRRHRLKKLEKERSVAETPIAKAALDKRIAELRIDDAVNRRTAQLGARVLVPYDLNSRHAIVNGQPVYAAGAPWSLEMWMGGWDTDALSFFVMGTVKIVVDCDPLTP